MTTRARLLLNNGETEIVPVFIVEDDGSWTDAGYVESLDNGLFRAIRDDHEYSQPFHSQERAIQYLERGW